MKKVFKVKREEEVEVDIQFPMYLKINNYTNAAILDEEQHIKISIYEKYRLNDSEPQQHSVYINSSVDKYETNSMLENFFSQTATLITPEEFDAFYFEARKLVAKQFNKLDNGSLPE